MDKITPSQLWDLMQLRDQASFDLGKLASTVGDLGRLANPQARYFIEDREYTDGFYTIDGCWEWERGPVKREGAWIPVTAEVIDKPLWAGPRLTKKQKRQVRRQMRQFLVGPYKLQKKEKRNLRRLLTRQLRQKLGEEQTYSLVRNRLTMMLQLAEEEQTLTGKPSLAGLDGFVTRTGKE